ncbi:putative ubiquitin hydrolase [Trypanosoma rangeli]|uniref:Putative ubiquitin hydrolase n=1 Tax=Trypanosoma rangeli TaxID=5698 RepID=A0A3R7KQX7_TRYRA|nr:putative ubiquitin hydrolase [Trypanosoma rangeli]RNF07967.1 putative ubiquitin hydrolase [Trypanosoma rangeli]|eukprot:RNF07967.1 putative ubiquitin hydrolase [Trypanosoma rangeli]
MNGRNDNLLPPIGSDDRVTGSESSMEDSSPGTVPPSTSIESGQDGDNVLWPEEQQGENNTSLMCEVENGTAAAATPEAAEDLSVPSSGLINEGCTCYLNSLLQLLFHLGYFRNAVYRMPDEADEYGCSIPQALKELLFHMQKRTTPGHTKKLTAAFGWTERELFIQHDIQEMATLLRDNLEEKMKGTVTEGTINQLFEGRGEQVVMTLDKAHVSRSRDTFYDIHLPLTPYVTLIESLRSLTVKEQLVGDNKYRVEEPGKKPEYKDAEKSYEFRRFPPVIWFHLKRFEMNLMSPSLEMKKVNSRLEFPLELCLQEFEKGDEGSDTGATQNQGNEKHAGQTMEPQQQPFSTHSPAIYDLQGVIVHRGSVRSGHYYCYIRQWDPVHERFVRWIEYDDEKVTVVSEDLAVSNNFGGHLMRQGRSSAVMATNNAYILSYVRRADCPKVLAPPPLDSIPQRVLDALESEILEEERRQRIEDEQRRKLNIVLFTDDIIREYVDAFPSELFPRDTRTAEIPGIVLEVQKQDTVRLVYDKVATHKQLSALHLVPGEFCLWRSLAHRGQRRDIPLKIHTSRGDTLMTSYLDRNEELGSPMTTILLYLQLPTTLPPFPVTDATPLICEAQKSVGVNEIRCSMHLRYPTQLDAVMLYLECSCDRRYQLLVYLELLDTDGFLLEYKDRGYASEQTVFNLKVNPEGRLIQKLVYQIETPGVPSSVGVREIRLGAPAAALPSLQPKYSPGEAVLQEPTKGSVLIFFKYFNYVTHRLTYAGSAIVPLTATIEACANVLRHLLGEEGTVTRPIQMLEERRGIVHPLRNDETIASISAVVLVGQQKDAPLVCCYPGVENYLSALSHAIHARIMYVKFGKRNTSPTLMLDSNNSRSGGSCSSVYTTGKGEVGRSSGDVLAGDDGAGGGVAGKCHVLEFVLSTAEDSGECCDTNFYNSRRFEVVREYAMTMDTRWSYAEVCHVVGEKSGYDPNYIRLYRADTSVAEQLSPEVDPSLSTETVGNILNSGRNAFFFEVLPEPRRLIEAMPRVIATVRTEKNEPLYTEKLVVRQNVTFGELVQGILQRCFLVLQRRRSAASAAVTDGSASSHTSDHAMRTGAHSTTSTRRSSRATTPFVIGLHYLILVVDVGAGVIKQIIEAPMTPDGKCNCRMPVLAGREPLTLSLVPAQPLQDNQFRLACCQGEWRDEMYGYPPLTFGQPFVVTVSDSITVTGAREVLLAYTGVLPSEVESSKNGVLMYLDVVRSFPSWDDKLFLYWKCTENHSNRIPSLMLNHKRPRERQGSRYVAQNNPTLRISKR